MTVREALNRSYGLDEARGNSCYEHCRVLSGWGIAREYGWKAFCNLMRRGFSEVDSQRTGGTDEVAISAGDGRRGW